MRKEVNLRFILPFVLLTSACDPYSTVTYTICNECDSAATIVMRPSTEGYIQRKDSIEWYTPNEENVIIRKSEFICEKFGWMNATIESHTPLWEDISSISIGDKTLSPEKWGNEKNWTFHKSGGHFFGLGEEWSYRLILKNEDSQ